MPTAKGHYEIYDTGEPQWDRFTLGSLKIEYAVTPDIGLTSITGLWSNNSLVSQDGTEENSSSTALGSSNPATPPAAYDASAGGLGPTGPGPFGPGVEERDYTRQLSEEIRVASTGNGPFQWLAGYYYQDFQSEWDMWSINPQAGPVADIYVDYQPQTILQNAAFGNVSWEFPFGLKASAGARWYHYSYSQRNSEWGDFTPYGFDNLVSATGPTVAGNLTPFNTNASNSANGTNPRFNLTWQIDRDHMVYGTIAKGFRLGGTDQPFVGYQTPVSQTICSQPPSSLAIIEQCGLQSKLTATPSTPGHVFTSLANFPNVNSQGVPQFNSDSVWDYEIGTKNELFDHRALFNLTAYFER
jgi:outer membrane receptor protein involved in Fe transport